VHRRSLPDGVNERASQDVVTGTSYRDTGVTANGRYAYTVQAVDRAGNLSALSAAVEETAR
jgi:chitodextrinase